MTQEYYSTGRKKFQHLTSEKRAQLEILLKVTPKIPKTKIAEMLGIARSTLYEELKRGSVEQLDSNLIKFKKYFADVGQRVYEEHRQNSKNPYNAYEDIKRIYEYYAGRKFNEPIPKKGKASVKLIHYVQSFDPKDKMSIDTAQQIALDVVKEMFGETVQAVIATHDDKPHLHTHIMVNVFDLNGNRFHSNQTSLNKIKSISNKVCLKYGIKPFDR